jgi:anti-anti-sigma factor
MAATILFAGCASLEDLSMKLSLLSIEKAGFVRLAVEGDITSRDFLDLDGRNALENVLGAGWASNNILLSLEKAIFIDSAAIGWLIDCQRQSKAAGGKLILHSAPPRVGDLFTLLKLSTALNLKENESAAQKFLALEGIAA